VRPATAPAVAVPGSAECRIRYYKSGTQGWRHEGTEGRGARDKETAKTAVGDRWPRIGNPPEAGWPGDRETEWRVRSAQCRVKHATKATALTAENVEEGLGENRPRPPAGLRAGRAPRSPTVRSCFYPPLLRRHLPLKALQGLYRRACGGKAAEAASEQHKADTVPRKTATPGASVRKSEEIPLTSSIRGRNVLSCAASDGRWPQAGRIRRQGRRPG